jgi:peptide/nickel transport system ATP-binding protein
MYEARDPLLSVRDLKVKFSGSQHPAVRGVTFDVEAGETLGIVGESGSGKSATLKAILRILRPSTELSGEILWQGNDLLRMSPSEMSRVRGRGIAMIFQEPMSALNPILEVGLQITEVLKVHQGLGRHRSEIQAIELLERVGIASASKRMTQYPFELSGGMRQRVMIAIALAAKPSLLLADEPTTALDVSIQDQILVLLKDLTAELGMSLILVTHDLGVVAETCDRVAVMYSGRIVESGPTAAVFAEPKHAYTAALIASVPEDVQPRSLLHTIKGQPGAEILPGCAFEPRCEYAVRICADKRPDLTVVRDAHCSACHRADAIKRPAA